MRSETTPIEARGETTCSTSGLVKCFITKKEAVLLLADGHWLSDLVNES